MIFSTAISIEPQHATCVSQWIFHLLSKKMKCIQMSEDGGTHCRHHCSRLHLSSASPKIVRSSCGPDFMLVKKKKKKHFMAQMVSPNVTNSRLKRHREKRTGTKYLRKWKRSKSSERKKSSHSDFLRQIINRPMRSHTFAATLAKKNSRAGLAGLVTRFAPGCPRCEEDPPA